MEWVPILALVVLVGGLVVVVIEATSSRHDTQGK